MARGRHLRDFAGALLFVTHDRAFLRRLATRIIELDRGRLTSWPGSYDTYLEKKAAALETEARDLERLDKKLAEEEVWLRRGIKARRTRNEGRVRALLALRAERAGHRAQAGAVRMALVSRRVVRSTRLRARAGEQGATAACRSSRDSLGCASCAAIVSASIGPNGSGKTTLLRLLLDEIEPDSGEVRHGTRLQVAYFDQQRAQLDPGSHGRRKRRRRQRHGHGQRPAAARPRLPGGLPVPARARAVAGEVAVGRRAQPPAAGAAVRPAGQRARARRADQRPRHRDARTARRADRHVRRHRAARHPRPRVPRQRRHQHARFEGRRDRPGVRGRMGGLRSVRSRRSDRSSSFEAVRRRERKDGRRTVERSERLERRTKEARLTTKNASMLRCRRGSRRSRSSSNNCRTEAASAEFYKAPADHIQSVLARIETSTRELGAGAGALGGAGRSWRIRNG